MLFTRRTDTVLTHKGQISFPGGQREDSDSATIETALRESYEEIGLEPRFVSVVGFLADHILLTGFRVTPVVGFVRPGFKLLLDRGEVQDTFEVPLSHVFEPANHLSRRRQFGAMPGEVQAWDIEYEGHNIWGATAGMLLNLYRLCVTDDAATIRDLAGLRDE